MNFMTINLRGIIDCDKSIWVKRLKRENRLSFIAIQETHQSGISDLVVNRFWDNGPMGFESIDSVGRSGGLFSVWDSSLFMVDAVVKNRHFLIVSGSLVGYPDRLNVGNVYAPNDPANRRRVWEEFLDCSRDMDGLWVVLGDFNEVRCAEDRVNSGFDPLAASVFNDFIARAGWLEFQMCNGRYTYMSDNGNKLSKIDRALVCADFMARWPTAVLEALSWGPSDHRPIVLKCSVLDFGPIPFKLFNSWIGSPELNLIVANRVAAMDLSGGGSLNLLNLLKAVKAEVKSWRVKAFDVERIELENLSKEVEVIDNKAELGSLTADERKRRIELKSKLKAIECKRARDLQQKARLNWIKLGDENSSYFHKCVKTNLARSRINGLWVNGKWCSKPIDLKMEIRKYFKSQFSEPIRRRPSFSNVGLPSLSVHQGASLISPFTRDEVKAAVFACDGGKAPGPDGFSLKFFKYYWPLLEAPVMGLMEELFFTGQINSASNASFVALIPKINDPQLVTDYRPISLVGSIIKIISKVLACRLKPLLNNLISPTQAAFVGNRNIIDNPLIISELVSWSKRSKKKLLIFKVDFQKAYDTLNWKFLLRTLEFMGFPSLWNGWVETCLRTAKGSVLVNGSPTLEFNYKRGLRQGDPLSPFLFILAMEVLSMFVNRAVDLGWFKGCVTPNNGPVISHLCYADDVLFVGEGTEDNVRSLARLLRCISLVTGLNVNKDKSHIYGVGIEADDLTRMSEILKCSTGSFPFNYLGLPIGANMKIAKYWKPVVDKFYRRLSSWKAKSLSMAGRITLAKAVLGSLPSYFLSIFKALISIIKKLEGIRRDFVWGKVGSKCKLRWVKWDRFLKPKKLGGMGVGSISDFNSAMITKWWWRFKDDPSQLWARVVSALHKTRNDTKVVPVNKHLPGIWKDVTSIDDELLKSGIVINDSLQVKVGDGYNTRFWKDKWIEGVALMDRFPGLYRLAADQNGSVAGHITFRGDTTFWGWKWRRDPCSNAEWEQVHQLMSLLQKYVLHNDKDKWAWSNADGFPFSVRCLRNEMAERRAGPDHHEAFGWNNWATPKANLLVWRSCMDRIAAKSKLAARGVQLPNILCDRCGLEIETVDHVFASCLFARSVWWNIFAWIKVAWPPDVSSLSGYLAYLKQQVGSKRWKKMVTMIAMASSWRIWYARNLKTFEGIFLPVHKTLDMIKEDSFLWLSHRSRGLNPSWDKWVMFDVGDLV